MLILKIQSVGAASYIAWHLLNLLEGTLFISFFYIYTDTARDKVSLPPFQFI